MHRERSPRARRLRERLPPPSLTGQFAHPPIALPRSRHRPRREGLRHALSLAPAVVDAVLSASRAPLAARGGGARAEAAEEAEARDVRRCAERMRDAVEEAEATMVLVMTCRIRISSLDH